MDIANERNSLRAQRDDLDRLGKELMAEGAALATSHDLPPLRAHGIRVREHLEKLHTFIVALEDFHARVGPLGH